jgi:hypothetical protein
MSINLYLSHYRDCNENNKYDAITINDLDIARYLHKTIQAVKESRIEWALLIGRVEQVWFKPEVPEDWEYVKGETFKSWVEEHNDDTDTDETKAGEQHQAYDPDDLFALIYNADPGVRESKPRAEFASFEAFVCWSFSFAYPRSWSGKLYCDPDITWVTDLKPPRIVLVEPLTDEYDPLPLPTQEEAANQSMELRPTAVKFRASEPIYTAGRGKKNWADLRLTELQRSQNGYWDEANKRLAQFRQDWSRRTPSRPVPQPIGGLWDNVPKVCSNFVCLYANIF